ncbi:hypothetical protein HLV35_03085 [Eggerthellaceae bacterium zg-997]|nr:hypothetical protein [Eggerthellaceae bacterium zg-997]
MAALPPLATPADLSLAWPGYEPSMEGRARALLSYVSAAIRSMCDADALDPELTRGVACQAAARMMQASQAGAGVSQESWTASPYGGSVTYANPTGDVYLTSFEKRLLGVEGGECVAAFVVPGAPE